MTNGQDLRTRGGTRYRVLNPVYKYQVCSIAEYSIPAKYALDLCGVDSIRIRNRPNSTDLAQIEARRVWVYPGYCWDGPSGPAIDTDDWMDASLVHDVLCQAIDTGRLSPSNQVAADGLMRHVAREHGMPFPRAWWSWVAVRAYRSRKVRDYEWPRI